MCTKEICPTKVVKPVPYQPVRTGYAWNWYPAPLIPSRLKYRCLAASTGASSQSQVRWRYRWIRPVPFCTNCAGVSVWTFWRFRQPLKPEREKAFSFVQLQIETREREGGMALPVLHFYLREREAADHQCCRWRMETARVEVEKVYYMRP